MTSLGIDAVPSGLRARADWHQVTDGVFGKEGAEGPNRSSHPGTPSQDQFLVGFWLPSRSVAEKLRALRGA